MKLVEKMLVVDADKCTGCQTCELICSMVKTGEYNPAKSCIKVLKNMEMDVTIPVVDVSCDFCGKCADWCFDNAIEFVSFEDAALIRKENKLGRFPAPIVGH